MRDGLRVSFALNEFVVAALCITVIACSVGYLYTHALHPAALAAPTPACEAKGPEITIDQVFYLPVPTTIVKIQAPAAVPPDAGFTPDPNLDRPPEPSTKPEQPDPVFDHRPPIVTSALKQPMPR